MDGFPVKQALPTQKVQQVDPYLLLHHGKIKPLFDRPAHIQGVGPHPHRGFSPVTFVVSGEVRHRDSRGNNEVAKIGDVQWLHAGAGIIHSERPTEDLLARKEKQEIIQLWINSPATKKMIEPSYQHIAQADFPKVESEDGGVLNRLITGNYAGLKGPITAQSELLILWAEGSAAGQMSYEIPDGYSTCIYAIKGGISIAGFGMVDPENLIIFETEGSEIKVQTSSECQFLVLAGKPLNEKMTHQGPFVMNTQTEIMEAMRDYRMGKMGVLIED